MANGNGRATNGNGGRLFNGRFDKVDDMVLKIGTGVITALLIAGLVFGMRVYAFMSTGARHTPEMDAAVETSQYEYIEEHYVQSDVYERDREHLDERLERMEKKLDQLLLEK